LLRELLRRGVGNSVVAPMWDPDLANYVVSMKGYKAGDKIEESIEIGGKMDATHGGGPICTAGAEVMLVSANGAYVGSGPMIGGLSLSFGQTCVLRLEGLVDVLIVSEIEQLLDQSQLSTFGIDPKAKQVIAAKSMQHFRAAYEPIASKVIVCDSGAIATPDVAKLHFEKVKRPVYPLDKMFSFSTITSDSKAKAGVKIPE
jgi:microcystin degradation protein MlrC